MKPQDIRELTDEEIQERIRELTGGAFSPPVPERHHGVGKPEASYGNSPGHRPDEDGSSRA